MTQESFGDGILGAVKLVGVAEWRCWRSAMICDEYLVEMNELCRSDTLTTLVTGDQYLPSPNWWQE